MMALLKDQRVRYLIVGGFAAGISWVVRFPLSEFLPYFLAVIIATGIGMVLGFFSYKYLVFTATDRPLYRQIIDFIGVNVAGGTVVVIVAALINHALAWPQSWRVLVEAGAHAVGLLAGAVANYIGHRYITFSSDKK